MGNIAVRRGLINWIDESIRSAEYRLGVGEFRADMDRGKLSQKRRR